MSKEIKITLTSGTAISIPDSNTLIPSFSAHAITTPSVAAESSGTSIKKFAKILESDFATHINDLHANPLKINITWTSGTSKKFMVRAEKRGASEKGMSSWYIRTSNDYEMRVAESVIQKSSDLNQAIEALIITAAGGTFSLKTKDLAIQKTAQTIKKC